MQTIKSMSKFTERARIMNAKCFHIVLSSIWIFGVVPIGFAEDFQSRPALAELNELVTQGIVSREAVLERRSVVNCWWEPTRSPYCGPWQPYFASLQQELERLPPMYIDHVSGPLTNDQTGFLYFTLATWRAGAGLNENGFRRTGWDGVFSYGYAQAGDIIGPWIYEDIQHGYSALKWTRWINYSKISDRKQYGDRDTTSYAAAVSGWNSASWNYDSGGAIYSVRARKGLTDWGNVAFVSTRHRSLITLNSLPAIDRSMDIYLYPIDYGMGLFLDFDSTGCTGFGKWYLHGSVAQFSGATYTTDYIGDINTCPLTLAGLYDSAPNNAYSFYVSYACLLMKWNFTH